MIDRGTHRTHGKKMMTPEWLLRLVSGTRAVSLKDFAFRILGDSGEWISRKVAKTQRAAG